MEKDLDQDLKYAATGVCDHCTSTMLESAFTSWLWTCLMRLRYLDTKPFHNILMRFSFRMSLACYQIACPGFTI
jgi:hypothetical protein